MSQKRPNPFGFLFGKDSDTESASEGDSNSARKKSGPKKLKYLKLYKAQVNRMLKFWKVEPGRNVRSVEIIKVESARKKKSPDVEIVKVVPGSSTPNSDNDSHIQWPIHCRKLKVDGHAGKQKEECIQICYSNEVIYEN